MLKLFGFRITPFFLFILSMECLALLACIYLGVLLYSGTPTYIPSESIDGIIYSGVVLLLLISFITPGFLSQTKVINHIQKTFNEKIGGVVAAVFTMLLIVFSNSENLEGRTIFAAAILSACVGLSVTQMGLFGKYWRFLIRSGVN
tara:strand:- start:29455 stop:29892 length:438 start_codon:yes stop_codon:yes gene_type:complete